MNVEHIPAEDVDVLPSGADWQSRHLESERRKAEIRDRIHKQAEQGQKTAKDYFRPAKPTPSIYDSDLKRVAVYARVSTSSEEQISSIENQTLYYTKKIAETENWNLQDIYSDEGKSGTSLRKRDAFKRMMRDAKDQKMDLIICASISRFARNFLDCMTQIAALKTMHPAHPIGVYFERQAQKMLWLKKHYERHCHLSSASLLKSRDYFFAKSRPAESDDRAVPHTRSRPTGYGRPC